MGLQAQKISDLEIAVWKQKYCKYHGNLINYSRQNIKI
jgi:hypothetical protein